MFRLKKAAALAACILVCLNSAVLPAQNSFAENKGSDTSANADSSNDIITSGDISYTLTDEGNACITDCAYVGDEFAVPSEIDGVTVTEINRNAFKRLIVEKLTIPATVEYISAENPFAPSENLAEIAVEEGNENYCAVDGILFSKDMKKLIHYPKHKSGKSYTVPDGVEEIGIAAIMETELTEINLPSTLNTLSRHALCYNEKLASIDMSSTSIEIVDVMAFVNCTSLAEVKFSDSTDEIALAAFMGCEKLESVTLPPNLIEIGQNAFMGTAIKRVRIPNSVTAINYCAFGYDMDENPYEDFVIIGERGSLAEIYARDTDPEYDYTNNFTYMTNEQADRQEELQALGTKVSGNFEYAVVDGSAMIVACSAANHVLNVPEELDGYTVTSIYNHAFVGCTSEEIILPETVKTIEEEAFGNVLVSLTIPGGCTEIQGDEPFLLCTALKEINVTEGDGAYSSIDGVLYNKDRTVLITYPAEKEDKSYKAPKSLEEIALSAFSYNQHIEEVDLSTVKTIMNYAFEGCAGVSYVKLSKDLETVGHNAFLGCGALTSVHIYNKVKTIGDYAFGYVYDAELDAQMAQTGASGLPYSVKEDFKIFTDEGTLAYEYAQAHGIPVETGKVLVGKKNLSKPFIYVMSALAGVIALGAAGLAGSKLLSKKKGERKK